MHGSEYLVGQHYAIWMEQKGLADWSDYFEPWPPDEEKTRLIRHRVEIPTAARVSPGHFAERTGKDAANRAGVKVEKVRARAHE